MPGANSLPVHFGTWQTNVLPTISFSGGTPYACKDYGASWATTASINADLAAIFPAPKNGDEAILWNTNGNVGRRYHYAGGAWHYTTFTA